MGAIVYHIVSKFWYIITFIVYNFIDRHKDFGKYLKAEWVRPGRFCDHFAPLALCKS